jgi:hypothetical protein
VLLGIGTTAIRRANTIRELPYAAIPVFFAAQQLIEGGLWLALPAQTSSAHLLTIGYLLFSNVLWPIYVPIAIWMIEPDTVQRKCMRMPIMVGASVSLFFLAAMITHPVSAAIMGSHIDYNLPHPHDKIAFAFYAIATCLAPLLSSHKMVRLFGVILIASMIIAYTIYAMWFASVWCFFAALLSSVVLLHFLRRETPQIAAFASRPF